MSSSLRLPVFVLLGVSGLVGCFASDQQLLRRASFDMGCPEPQLQLVGIDAETTGVVGCGKRATYIQSCAKPDDPINKQCTWVKNSETKTEKE